MKEWEKKEKFLKIIHREEEIIHPRVSIIGTIYDSNPDFFENLKKECPDVNNGIDNIAKGKVSIDLDIDRQKIIPFGKAEDIDNHIKKCVEKLGSQNGGLLFLCGTYPGTPKENIDQVIKSMQKYYKFWVK